jgi:formylglycine-generating enzyme required for sulfatase activity
MKTLVITTKLAIVGDVFVEVSPIPEGSKVAFEAVIRHPPDMSYATRPRFGGRGFHRFCGHELCEFLLGFAFLSVSFGQALAGTAPQVSALQFSELRNGTVTPLKYPSVSENGGSFVASAEVTGEKPISYQWLFNGEPIEDATNETYRVTTIERADEGRYSLSVSNAAGSAVSSEVQLWVSNVIPNEYVGLYASGPIGTNLQVEVTESLSPPVNWRVLTNTTLSASPLLVVDGTSDTTRTRFYKPSQQMSLTAQRFPGWTLKDPTGSVHAVELIDTQGGRTDWEPLGTLTLSNSPMTFLDTTATNGISRRYRTTLLESPFRRMTGKLAFTVKWVLPEKDYDILTPPQKVDMSRIYNVSFDDGAHTILMATNALPGYWVVMGDQKVMSDTNGNFSIDVPHGLSNGFVVPRNGDRSTLAVALFTMDQLRPIGGAAPPIFVRFQRTGGLHMDGESVVGGSGPRLAGVQLADVLCGNPAAHVGNSEACCLDYDGYLPSDCKGAEDAATALPGYLGSTCYRLVNEGLCINEWNALRFPDGVPTWPGRGRGPSCFDNHKYRNCQNVNMNPNAAFTMSASALTVRCGESLDLTIYNNSPANETELCLEPFSSRSVGTLSGIRVISASSPQSFTLRHYEENVPRPFHVENDTIQYTAPSPEEMEPGVEEIAIRVRARANGVERTLDIRVSCGNCDSARNITPIPNMVWIPCGTFTMGSPDSELDSFQWEHPQTRVIISRGFWMGRYEVTQGDFLAIMGRNPSWFNGDRSSIGGQDYGTNLSRPVEGVSYEDAIAYCNALTLRESRSGRLPFGGYSLPSEAQWEYACRAGTTTPFHYGQSLRSGMASFDWRYEYPPTGSGSPSESILPETTSMVGSYAPNAWGLYDMHGNVWEWCHGYFGRYPGGTVKDLKWATGLSRVTRGGSWGFNASACRAAQRRIGSGFPGSMSGFRVSLQ